MKNLKITVFAASCFFILFSVILHFFCGNYKILVIKIEDKAKSSDIANATNWLKDWNNHTEIEEALNRNGFGEVGKPAYIDDYRKEQYNLYGFDALLSDHISLQRTVPDERAEACRNLTYLAQLPKATVIIIFYNELLSVLLRTVHGILNRTPSELLNEIILVDDSSTWSDMQKPLEEYLNTKLPTNTSKVRLLRRSTRDGIMKARMSGARNAKPGSEVFIFLDSHFEVGYNWLPPLLEPIALDPKTCTSPIIDRIAFDTFAYTNMQPWRGYFDYSLNYQMMALNYEEYENPTKNYKNYIMMGGALAIGKEFFWDLGGFDEGMSHWGGEQFEMSFKIWMCGGKLLDVPCSRMGHLFRDPDTKGNKALYGNYSFVARNYRRFLDVWVDDENRKFFLQRRPDLVDADPGDITDRLEIRDRLKCKDFNWMINHVMPDLNFMFPPIEPHDLANGFIQNLYDTKFCIALDKDKRAKLELCQDENNPIYQHKSFIYTWRGELRVFGGTCLETDINVLEVGSYSCHFQGGNQKWYYDYETKWIRKLDDNLCMFANIENRLIQLTKCDMENLRLKWTFSHINETEMKQWDKQLKL